MIVRMGQETKRSAYFDMKSTIFFRRVQHLGDRLRKIIYSVVNQKYLRQ
jgi:hypothetical protein